MAVSEWRIDEDKLSYTMMVLIHELMTRKEQKGKELSFANGFLEKTERYKYRVYESARELLDVESWTEDMIGSGEISERVVKAVHRSRNLVFYTSKAFEDKIAVDVAGADRVFYDLYCGEDDEAAFEAMTGRFGFRYDRTAFLFFLKDKERYLPVKPMEFRKRFAWMGIESDCVNGLSWEHYGEFVRIMREVQQRIQPFFFGEVSLLDAHSFVWCMYLLEKQIVSGEVAYEDFADGKVVIDREQWAEFLQNEEIFKKTSIDLLKRIYLKPNHASTCKRLAEEDHTEPSAYISPVVAPAKHIMKQLGQGPLKRANNENMWWPVLFLGRTLSDGLFEWKLRPELAEAMEDVFEEELAYRVQEEEACAISEEALYMKASEQSKKRGKKRTLATNQFARDPMISEYAKRMAGGHCQLCGQKGPFVDKKGRPYLETHHIKALADGGTDSIANVIALCPNCHQKMHKNGDIEGCRMDQEKLEKKAVELVENMKKKYD